MTDADRVKAAARRALDLILSRGDRMLDPWLTGKLGEPLLVTRPDGRPVFWLVAVEGPHGVLGAIEIGLDGQLRGQVLFYSDPGVLAACPRVVTGVTADEARVRAADVLARHAGGEFMSPVWVLDDVRQRPAWMLEVRRGGRWVSRVFVTSGEVWERRSDDAPREPGTRG